MFLEDLGFGKNHRKPLIVEYQIPDTNQTFPDNAFSGNKIENLNVSKLLAGSVRVSEYLQSTGFVTGTTGWQIKGDGTAEFVGITLSGGTFKYGKTSFTDSVNAGYCLGSEGLYCGAAADTTYIKYTVATGLIDLVGTISSRSTATIAAAINSSGNLVNDVINLRLDSSAKSILSDFAFASTDYSGALKCGTITWDATTGAITGGSGGVFHKGGIVFANAGVATITLDGATGNATFAGILSAPTGTIGGCTLASNSLTAGSAKVLSVCDGYNINGTWSGIYDAINVKTDNVLYMQGNGSVMFDLDVSVSGNNYAEILNTTMTSVDLSAFSGSGTFRLFVYIPDVTYITEVDFNWGSSGSDGYYQSATTQSNGQAFAAGWNELSFFWDTGKKFGSPNDAAIVYAAMRINYSASQADMVGVRLDFIACYSGTGAFKTYNLGVYGGLILDDYGLRGYDANNNPSVLFSALTGDIYGKKGNFEDLIVRGNISPIISLQAGENLTQGQAVYQASNGKIYATDGAVPGISEKFRGFIKDISVIAGNYGNVQIMGEFQQITGLSAYNIQYLANGTADASQTSHESATGSIYGNEWYGEVFTTSANMVRLTSVKLGLRKGGTPTGTLTVAIRATSGGKPTGANVYSSTMNVALLTTSYLDYTFEFDELLSASTAYAIIVYQSAGDSGNYVSMQIHSIGGGGGWVYSTDGGSNWTADATRDVYFSAFRGSGLVSTTPGTYTKKVGFSTATTKIDMIKN